MDMDDPIQQLLKNTGWSCEDLLEKLQKYKSQKEENGQGQFTTELGTEELTNEKPGDATKGTERNDDNEEITGVDPNVGEEFSDTDEDEVEINVKQSNIVGEIVDDIESSNRIEHLKSSDGDDKNDKKKDFSSETEVTEVRVIEINEDEDEECFEEEGHDYVPNKKNCKNFEYRETFPRKLLVNLSPIDLTGTEEESQTIDSNILMKSSENTAYEINEDINNSNLEDIKDDSTNNREYVGLSEINSKKGRNASLNLDIEINNKETTYETTKKLKVKSCENLPMNNTDNQVHEEGPEGESSLTNFEDIRNNLKLQLNCLRTRKQGHFLQQLRAKVSDTLDTNSNTNISNRIHSPTKKSNRSKDKEHLYTQTNEFGLVILSVEGGIDLEEQSEEKNRKNDKQIADATSNNTLSRTESHSNTSTLDVSKNNKKIVSEDPENVEETNESNKVFDEIRKIIRKQKLSSLNEKKNKAETETSASRKAINNFKFFTQGTKEHDKSVEKNEFSYTSPDISQSSFTNDDTNQTGDKNSPFVSNTLDEFLTENSKLNISYKVPKSGAEEGLTDNYNDESPLLLKKMMVLNNSQAQVSKKFETIKAKTVAQKRKLLEKQRQRELKKELKVKSQLKNQPKEKRTDARAGKEKQSYIEINNKRLWVNGTKPNTCVAKINSVVQVGPTLKQQNHKRKLSLLTDLGKKVNEKIKYLPGPLSKKSTLQLTGHDNWITDTKFLPKIFLEVFPKIGQPLPPIAESKLPKCNGVITKDLAEFALSVLKTNNDTNDEQNMFKFPIKYINNQEKIIVRKPKTKTALKLKMIEKSNKEMCGDNVIQSILDDLITYVEIKELAPSLIKDDMVKTSSTDTEFDKLPVIAENISNIIKKAQKRKSRVELELSRLNCKVVNVEVEENSNDELCNKPYCQMGCVCKSLKCDGLITYHCQKVSCMLECKCPREKSIEYDKLMLPAGTDILSKDTVTRIEDEAKKDLAKEEREFTQMVIHTNDKTIVVGTGGRHKTRRSTKAPVKYSDYVNSSHDSNIANIEKSQAYVKPKPQQAEKNMFPVQCAVSLERLNLKEIIPYCMFHNLYSCHCEGKSLSSMSPVPERIPSKSPAEEKTPKKIPPDKYKPVKAIKISPPKQSKIQKEVVDISSISSILEKENEVKEHEINEMMLSTSGRPIRSNKKLKDDFTFSNELDFQLTSCARTLGIPLRKRVNRKLSNKDVNKKIKNDFSNNISPAEIEKAKQTKDSSDELEADILKRHLVLEAHSRKESVSLIIENAIKESNHKRKQKLEIRNDDAARTLSELNLAIQRRKKVGVVNQTKQVVIEPVFDGEIIIDEKNMELLQKMGSRTVTEGYARLLPWTALIEGFNKGNIKVWCMVDQPSRLLINTSDKNPPKNYIDIKQTVQSTEVISWILKNKLPPKYHKDHVSFILKQTKNNYEICGLCTKNLKPTKSNPQSMNSDPHPTDSTSLTDTEIVNVNKTSTDDCDQMSIMHKDLNGTQQTLLFSKGVFQLQELVEENLADVGDSSIESNKMYMWAALPEIYGICKWKMIFLNSDFTFLYFDKIHYSIKYTDLVNASIKARETDSTVKLQNQTLSGGYEHTAFGMYFDPHYQDRFFIGPYFKKHKGDDVKTLRYVNQLLVCTESFNKMQGKTDYKCGHWLIERPYSRKTAKPMMDLTGESLLKSSNSKRKISTDSSQLNKKPKYEPKKDENVIVTEDYETIKVLDSEPRTPEDFNRYIITNIPHLGYLGAIQHDDSTCIDVSWPFENKMLRFPSVSCATNFLQTRFSSLLQPIPESFKISIIVLTHIDLVKTSPINASILSGHYICGEFGCYSVKTVTNEFCIDKLGMSRDDLLRIFMRRAQTFVKEKMEKLAQLLNIPKSDRIKCTTNEILKVAKKEIDTLKETESQYVVEKRDLLLRKRDLALKAFCLISTLPESERNMESWKFRQTLRRQPIQPPKSAIETIEIPDSDDEEKNINQNEGLPDQNLQQDQHNPNKDGSGGSSGFDFMDQDSQYAKIIPLPRAEPVKENQTATSTYPPQRKLKSILKSNSTLTSATPTDSRGESSNSVFKQPSSTISEVNQDLSKTPSPTKPQYLSGVKLVKTNEGKLVLVSDNTSPPRNQFQFSGGKQILIKNSKILSIKTADRKESEEKPSANTSVASDRIRFNKTQASPPKTIVLKKRFLLPKSQFAFKYNKIVTQNDTPPKQNGVDHKKVKAILNSYCPIMPKIISVTGNCVEDIPNLDNTKSPEIIPLHKLTSLSTTTDYENENRTAENLADYDSADNFSNETNVDNLSDKSFCTDSDILKGVDTSTPQKSILNEDTCKRYTDLGDRLKKTPRKKNTRTNRLRIVEVKNNVINQSKSIDKQTSDDNIQIDSSSGNDSDLESVNISETICKPVSKNGVVEDEKEDNRQNFLANAVSEIFPPKPDCEMSEMNIIAASAASLTQYHNAAKDNSYISSLVIKENQKNLLKSCTEIPPLKCNITLDMTETKASRDDEMDQSIHFGSFSEETDLTNKKNIVLNTIKEESLDIKQETKQNSDEDSENEVVDNTGRNIKDASGQLNHGETSVIIDDGALLDNIIRNQLHNNVHPSKTNEKLFKQLCKDRESFEKSENSILYNPKEISLKNLIVLISVEDQKLACEHWTLDNAEEKHNSANTKFSDNIKEPFNNGFTENFPQTYENKYTFHNTLQNNLEQIDGMDQTVVALNSQSNMTLTEINSNKFNKNIVEEIKHIKTENSNDIGAKRYIVVSTKIMNDQFAQNKTSSGEINFSRPQVTPNEVKKINIFKRTITGTRNITKRSLPGGTSSKSLKMKKDKPKCAKKSYTKTDVKNSVIKSLLRMSGNIVCDKNNLRNFENDFITPDVHSVNNNEGNNLPTDITVLPEANRISHSVSSTFSIPDITSNPSSVKENTVPPGEIDPLLIETDFLNTTSKGENEDIDISQTFLANNNLQKNSLSDINREITLNITKMSASGVNEPVKIPIKYVSAQINPAFSIDENSFSKIHKTTPKAKTPKTTKVAPSTAFSIKAANDLFKKSDSKQEIRLRKKIIRAGNLICASKILSSTKTETNKTNKSSDFSIADSETTKSVVKFDKQSFQKNAAIVEKCIDIGNLKKKLRANIREDSDNNSNDVKISTNELI